MGWYKTSYAPIYLPLSIPLSASESRTTLPPAKLSRDDKLECISGSTNSLNYTGRLTSKTDQDSASLVASLEGWASEEPTVSVEGVLLRVTADECTGILTDVNSDVCPNRRSDGSGESKTAVETGAPIAAAIVFAAIVAGVIVIILYFVIRNRRMGQRRDGLDQQPQLISE